MVGSAEHIWAEIEMAPDTPTANEEKEAQPKVASTAIGRSRSSMSNPNSKQSEVRKTWLLGSVAVHQDTAEGKARGQSAFGEALYLDNGGKGKAIAFIYQRDPTARRPLLGPLPPALVENDNNTITASGGDGIIKVNQATDQTWVEGPGTLSQLSMRNKDAASTVPTASERPDVSPTGGTATSTISKPRAVSFSAQNAPKPGLEDKFADASLSARAHKGLSEKVLSTIRFTEGMEFNGRSIDPKGKAAGRADFYGRITALLEDALLHGEEGMIAYTDRSVPFAQLGALNRPKSNQSNTSDLDSGGDKVVEDGPQLALIECYRNAIGISRKVDPILQEVLQQQRIEAEELLVYERRTGDFHIPGRGKVFLYDRSDNSRAQGESSQSGSGTVLRPAPSVKPTSSQNHTGMPHSTSRYSAGNCDKTEAQQANDGADSKSYTLPPVILTQIHFLKGMRGRFGTTGERDPTQPQWYEFFGDIELGRAKVSSTAAASRLNFDKLPADSIFLTAKTLRIRTEPPPAGSPPPTPARDYVKAWGNAKVHSSDKTLESDVITYDSEKDLIYAFGEAGRGVIYAQQFANGQPASKGLAKAVSLNPKTGTSHFIENAAVQLIDKNSGVRPQSVTPVDPDFKQKKRPKKGFRIPNSNVERRGFTGQ
jgi:hypothetical protein